MASMTGAGPIQSQEPGTPSWSLSYTSKRVQVFVLFSTAFPGTLAGSWVGSGASNWALNQCPYWMPVQPAELYCYTKMPVHCLSYILSIPTWPIETEPNPTWVTTRGSWFLHCPALTVVRIFFFLFDGMGPVGGLGVERGKGER